MMSGELNAPAPRERWPLDDVHARPIVTLHVAVARGEVLRTPAVQIARDRQCLDKHLRHHDRAAEIQDDAAVVEIRQHTGESLEIAMARGADRTAVGGWMLMHDLCPDRRVHRDRDAQLGAGEQY